MKKKQLNSILVFALIAGFIGGAVSSQLFTVTPVCAEKGRKVVVAQEFRLVDEKGVTIGGFRVHPKTGPFLMMGDYSSDFVVLTPSWLQLGKGTKSALLDGSRLSLSDENNCAVLHPDSLQLLVLDGTFKARTVLGSITLETIKNGTPVQRSAASLCLFDEKGKVIWSTPQ